MDNFYMCVAKSSWKQLRDYLPVRVLKHFIDDFTLSVPISSSLLRPKPFPVIVPSMVLLGIHAEYTIPCLQ